jgi:hypothetical protein
MRVVTMFDEVLGGVSVKAGTTIPATVANSDELDGLVTMLRAYTVPDAPSPSSANVQFAVLDQRAKRPFRGIALSNGVVPSAAPAFTPLATILSNDAGPYAITNDAGGKVALVGRLLVATAKPIVAGETITVAVTVNGVPREFTIAGAGMPIPAVPTTPPVVTPPPVTPPPVVIPPTPAPVGGIVPNDWRMVASAAYSTQAGAAATLMADQSTPASKGRTKYTVAAGEVASFAYRVAASVTGLIFPVWRESGTAVLTFEASTDSTDGANGTWLPVAYSPTNNEEQVAYPGPGPERWVRVTANGVPLSAATVIMPRLNQKPVSGPWDCRAIIGASREDSRNAAGIYAAIMARYPNCDPIIVHIAKPGDGGTKVIEHLNAKLPGLTGAICYGILGSVYGNDVTDYRPYGESSKAGIDNAANQMVALLKNAGIIPIFSDTSLRLYKSEPVVTITTQDNGGSLTYNQQAIWPAIARLVPDSYDPDYKIARNSHYFYTVYTRGNLGTDGIHSTATGYQRMNEYEATTYERFIHEGTWPVSFPEKVVEFAEASANYGGTTTEARAAHLEITYQLFGLPDTTFKTALVARQAAVLRQIFYREAEAFVVAYEAAPSQANLDAANAQIAIAEANGAVVAPLRARLASPPAPNRIVQFAFRNYLAPGWNAFSASVLGVKTVFPYKTPGGVDDPDNTTLFDSQGNETPYGVEILRAWNKSDTNGPLTSLIEGFPDAVMQTYALGLQGSPGELRLTGLNPAKRYTLVLTAGTRSTSAGSTRFTVTGTEAIIVEPIPASNNNTIARVVSRVQPTPDGFINIYVSGNSTPTYWTGARLLEFDA